MPDVHANYRADTCTGMVETSREKLEMGFHGHEVSVRTRPVEDISRSPSKASPSYGKVRDTDLVHLVLVARIRKPADAGKTSRPVHAADLCRKCVVSRRTLRSMMGQKGCRVYHCCRHTMVSKLKLDHNEVPRAFVQKNRRSVLPKSLRTHPDHTPHVDLSSLFVHSLK